MSIEQQPPVDEGPIELSFRLPLLGHNVLVQCPGFRCLAYRDPDGNWRDAYRGDILSNVATFIPEF
jgi:hypothetical protein